MDIDNTLAARNSWAVPEKHIDWLQKLQEQDIRIVLASNNGGKRISAIEKQLTEHGLHILLLRWAGKPFPRAYAGAIRLLEESAAKEGRAKLDLAKDPAVFWQPGISCSRMCWELTGTICRLPGCVRSPAMIL